MVRCSYDRSKIENELKLFFIYLKKGRLSWQNELNSLNKPFFDACDGVFLNYFWSCGNLANSISALDDDSRKKDIFVGVDVWGRGTYGGGQFQCDLVIIIICQF